MQKRLLNFLRCPDCRKEFELIVFEALGSEISEGVLHCPEKHFFPVVRSIPRMLPSSLRDHWSEIEAKIPQPTPAPIQNLINENGLDGKTSAYDTRTKANFSNEWDNYEVGGKTWTMNLDDRVKGYFLDSIRVSKEDLNGKMVLDAGCGNGSQSVAYTEFGLEVIAVDLSTGLEKGYDFNKVYERGKPEKVHFVQADLQNPPLAEEIFDIIHSAGVLHHTPNTEKTFRALHPLLKKGGTFYIWLYKYENVVTPIVNSIRAVTTRLPASIFAAIADLTAYPFIGFCWTVNKLGIRSYGKMTRKEAALAVHDIFGAPYAHYHLAEEVSGWYKSVGAVEIWECNDTRRGFGVCGRISTENKEDGANSAKA